MKKDMRTRHVSANSQLASSVAADELACARLCLRNSDCGEFTYYHGNCFLYHANSTFHSENTGALYSGRGLPEACIDGTYKISCDSGRFIERCVCHQLGFYGDRCQYAVTDCLDALEKGLTPEPPDTFYSVVWIKPRASDYPFQVVCNWRYKLNVFLWRRSTSSVRLNFNALWESYKHGIGHVNTVRDDFWLGLKKLHLLTTSACYDLRMSIRQVGGNLTSIRYQNFVVENEDTGFRIKPGLQHGYGPDSFNTSEGMPFSTYDKDNDASGGNCAREAEAGWWFNNCGDALPTGRYRVDGSFPEETYLSYKSFCSNCEIDVFTANVKRQSDSPCA